MPDPNPTSRAWFRRSTVIVAWAVLLLSVVHPPHGVGIAVCWMRATTGVPCPGCGLTRSISCAVRGMFSESWGYHPFGIIFLVAFAGVAVVSLLPTTARQRLDALISRHVKLMNAAYALFIAAFLAVGVTRALIYCLHLAPLACAGR